MPLKVRPRAEHVRLLINFLTGWLLAGFRGLAALGHTIRPLASANLVKARIRPCLLSEKERNIERNFPARDRILQMVRSEINFTEGEKKEVDKLGTLS
jgi:hypothetical protein